MIHGYVSDIAAQMGLELSRISVVEGRDVRLDNVSLLYIGTRDKVVSALVHRSELDDLLGGIYSDRLEVKVRSAISRLQILVEP